VTTVEQVWDALKTVYDPEIGINIVDLGLVYDVEVEAEKVHITHTLTSPACPLGPVINEQVNQTVGALPGVQNIKVDVVWSPPWDPRTMASEETKMELGIW